MRKGESKRPRQESINWMNVKKSNKREEEEKRGRKTGKARKKQVTGLEDQQWRQDSVINPVNWL